MNTIFIVLPILTILMFDLGLTLKPQDFKLIAQRPKPVIVGLVGQIILLPLIAWGLIHLTHYTLHITHYTSHLSSSSASCLLPAVRAAVRVMWLFLPLSTP